MPPQSAPLPAMLSTPLFWGLVIACVIAQLYIVRGLFNADPSGASPNAPREGVPAPRHWMEVAWALLPIAGLVATFVGTWRLMSR